MKCYYEDILSEKLSRELRYAFQICICHNRSARKNALKSENIDNDISLCGHMSITLSNIVESVRRSVIQKS